ncbi:MAG: TIGR03905 family TSCPD domain-containing protein [Lachnospiraceae bacterium]|nr:TIGR03905 family TSCPD domain-containing protein [Lachnospiraceae bacterium]
MEHFSYMTKGTCSRQILFDMDTDNTIHNVQFIGGCDGNLKAISKLVEGMKADEINRILSGNTCGGKNTSCADQLSIACMEALKEMQPS